MKKVTVFMEKENIIYQSEKDYGEIAEEVYISYPNNKGFEINQFWFALGISKLLFRCNWYTGKCGVQIQKISIIIICRKEDITCLQLIS